MLNPISKHIKSDLIKSSAYQLIFWSVAVLLLFYIFSNRNYDLNLRLFLVGTMTCISVGISLIVSELIIPKFLFRGKRFLFFYSLLGTLVITLWLLILMILMVIIIIVNDKPGMVIPSREDMLILVSGTLLIIVVYSVIHFINENYIKLLEQQQLKQSHDMLEHKFNEAKLSLLKSQVNPHFIFNVLNNIYSLVKDDPAQTRAYILKFTALLDLMLYEFTKNTISITKEIEFIQNYIELERLRHDDDFNVAFNVDNTSRKVEIAPLILFPFVENAFKFGFSDKIKSDIQIELKVSHTLLEFKVRNRFQEPSDHKNKNGGIGHKNIKERLDLIYQDKYELKSVQTEGYYTIVLKLSL